MWKRARSYRALGHLADVPVDQLLLLRGCDRGVAWQARNAEPLGYWLWPTARQEGSVSGGRRGGQAPLRMLHKRRRLRGNDDVDPSFNEELRVAAAEYHHVGTGVCRPRGPTHTRPLGSPAAPTTVPHHSRSNRARKALLPHHRYALACPRTQW